MVVNRLSFPGFMYRRLGWPSDQLLGCEKSRPYWDSILGPSNTNWVAKSSIWIKTGKKRIPIIFLYLGVENVSENLALIYVNNFPYTHEIQTKWQPISLPSLSALQLYSLRTSFDKPAACRFHIVAWEQTTACWYLQMCYRSPRSRVVFFTK